MTRRTTSSALDSRGPDDSRARRMLKLFEGLEERYEGRTDYLQKVRNIRDGIHSEEVTPYASLRTGQGKLKESGFEHIISNEPKILYDAAVRMLSSGKMPTYRLPTILNDDNEENKHNKSERFAIGVHRDEDRYLMSKGHEPLLRELAFWVCQGWYAVFPHVKTDPWSGQPQFRIELYDPIEVFPEYDSEGGLQKVFRRSIVSLDDVVNMVGEEKVNELALGDDPFTEVTIISIWERQQRVKEGQRGRKPKNKYRVIHSIMTGNGEWLKEPTEEDFPDIPILIGPVNGYAERGYTGSDMVQERTTNEHHYTRYQGRAILDNNLELYEEFDRALSLVAQHLSQSAYGTTFVQTEEGTLPFTEKEFGAGAVIPLKREDNVQQLTSQPVPQALSTLVDYFQTAMQKGSLPSQAFGVLPFEISGFLMTQIIQQVHNFMAPQITAMEYLLGQIMSMFMYQFQNGSFEKVALDIRTEQGGQESNYFIEDFKKNDVPDTSFIEVRLPLTIANDLISRAETARGLQGLISRQTTWEQVLGSEIVPDSQLEMQRVVEDQFMQAPDVVQQMNVQLAKRKAQEQREIAQRAGTEDEKNEALDWASFYDNVGRGLEMQQAQMFQQLNQQGQQGQQQPNAGGQRNANGEGNRQPRPQALPPEAGRVNPDILRAVIGAPAAGQGEQGLENEQVRQAIARGRRSSS